MPLSCALVEGLLCERLSHEKKEEKKQEKEKQKSHAGCWHVRTKSGLLPGYQSHAEQGTLTWKNISTHNYANMLHDGFVNHFKSSTLFIAPYTIMLVPHKSWFNFRNASYDHVKMSKLEVLRVCLMWGSSLWHLKNTRVNSTSPD